MKAIPIKRLILIALAGAMLLYVIIEEANAESILDEPVLYGALSVFFLAFAWVAFYGIRKYRKTKLKSNYWPIAFGIIITLSVGVTKYYLGQRDNSPVILKAGYYMRAEYISVYYNFREDGTYKFDKDMFLSTEHFRGTYIMHDSLITLDKANIGSIPRSNHFVIRKGVQYAGAQPQEIMYEINDTHEVVDKYPYIVVETDNRKK